MKTRFASGILAGAIALSPAHAANSRQNPDEDASAQPSRGAALLQTVVPHYARLQYSGFIGWLAVGTGYSLWDARVEPEVAYGYVPASIGGAHIHTLAQKTTVSPARVRIGEGLHLFPVLAGYSANVTMGESLFLLPPDRYPRKNYYWPTRFRFAVFTGTKLQRELPGSAWLRAAGLTAELGTHDAYWWNYRRSDRVGLTDILSMALSAQAYF